MKMKTKMTLKKVLCVILSVVIVAVGLPISAIAATAKTVDFAILSDTHYFAESAMGKTAEDKQEFVDMMLLNNSTTGLAPNLLDAALAQNDNIHVIFELQNKYIPNYNNNQTSVLRVDILYYVFYIFH